MPLQKCWYFIPEAIFVVLVVARIILAVKQRKVGCNCFREFLASLEEGRYEGGLFMGLAHSIEIFPVLFILYMCATVIGCVFYHTWIGVPNLRQETLRELAAYAGFLGMMGHGHQFCLPYYRRLLIQWVLCSQDIGTLEELLMGYLPVNVTPYLISTENKDECSICTDEMANQRCKLPCGHAFHALCVEKWLRRVHSCPLCRQPVVLKLRGTIID